MSWWLIPYTFSMLARYQPRKWSEALDIDKSPNMAARESALIPAVDVPAGHSLTQRKLRIHLHSQRDDCGGPLLAQRASEPVPQFAHFRLRLAVAGRRGLQTPEQGRVGGALLGRDLGCRGRRSVPIAQTDDLGPQVGLGVEPGP